MSRCAVCLDAIDARSSFLCRRCMRSYDRANCYENTIAAVVIWASKRARMFERRASRGNNRKKES